MTPLDAALREIGVTAPPAPKPPRPPHVPATGWVPRYPGEEPPF